MSHDQEMLDFDEGMARMGSASLQRVANEAVGIVGEWDERDGYFRDYPDTETAVARVWSDADSREAQALARGQRSWFAQLLAAVGVVGMCLGFGAGLRGGGLRGALMTVAALALSWVDAIDRRTEEKRLARMAGLPWWRRLAKTIGGWFK